MEQTTQRHKTTHRVPLARLAVAAVAVGGLSGSALAVTTAGATTHRAAKTVKVSITKTSKGKVLASGKTLYTLKSSSTPCTAACMKIWPALTLPKGVTKASAGSGVNSSKLGTKMLASGLRQVTYGGKPLYWFSGDTANGQVNGNVTDEWGKWAAIVTSKSGGGASTTNTTAGSGGTAF